MTDVHYRHKCIEWDGLEIDEFCPEWDACMCYRPKNHAHPKLDPLNTGYVYDVKGYWAQPNDDKVRVLERSLFDYARAYVALLRSQERDE